VDARNRAMPGLNTPGWVVAHAGFVHDVWINVDGQGKRTDECEPSLRAWIRKQDASRGVPIDADFDEVRAAFDRVAERATSFLHSLSDEALENVPSFEED